MAEVGMFTTTNKVTQNTTQIHEQDVEFRTGNDPCKHISVTVENNDVLGEKRDVNFNNKTACPRGPDQGNGEYTNSCANEPFQSENLRCDTQISLNTSSLTPVYHCSGRSGFAEQMETAPAITLPDTSTADPHGTGLITNTSTVANNDTKPLYFTRSTTISTPAEKDTSPTTNVLPTIPEPVVLEMMSTPASSAQMLIQERDCAGTNSSPPQTVIPQSLTQTLISLPEGVSTTAVTPGNPNAVAENPNLIAQSNSISTTVLTGSSVSSLVNSSSSVVFTTTSEVSKNFAPGVPVPDDGTATINTIQTAANSCVENNDSASVCNSSSSLLDIPTIFSNFTPCIKCNSILVCSCPGPSGVEGDNGSVLPTCQASCQGPCTCEGMEVDKKEDLKPFEQDVKPQEFPTPIVVRFERRRQIISVVVFL